MNSITCISPTKSFNLAGLQTAAIMIPNEYLRNKVNRGLNTDEAAEPNCFAVQAVTAAYGLGGEQFLRLNIACPKAVLKDGLNRLKKAILMIK